MMRITAWGKPKEYFENEHKAPDYNAWCAAEIKRAEKIGRRLEIIKNNKGEIALARIEEK